MKYPPPGRTYSNFLQRNGAVIFAGSKCSPVEDSVEGSFAKPCSLLSKLATEKPLRGAHSNPAAGTRTVGFALALAWAVTCASSLQCSDVHRFCWDTESVPQECSGTTLCSLNIWEHSPGLAGLACSILASQPMRTRPYTPLRISNWWSRHVRSNCVGQAGVVL